MRDFLHELASSAAREFPGCGVGLSVLRGGERQLAPAVATDSRAHRLDVAGSDSGPHEHAVLRDEVVHILDATSDRRWPAFDRMLIAEGMASAIIHPLDIDEAETTAGLLAVYSPEPGQFDSTERVRILERFVDEATRALALAARLTATQERAVHLERALVTRATIDHAVGVLMAQNRCTADDAFAMLVQASQNRNIKLRRLARDIVADVSGQAPVPSAPFR